MSFESGVASYIHATATVDVFFPVDARGNAYVCCEQCFFYRDGTRRCALTGDVSAFPAKYVGATCPLETITDENGEVK